MRLSIVIPTVDRQESAGRVLRHLEAQSVAPSEILVIDQTEVPSQDLANRPGVRYVHLEERGLPNARNVGAAQAKGDVILFLDDDVVPHRDLVRCHLEGHERPGVGGVGGKIIGGYDRPDARAQVGTFDPVRGLVIRNFQSEEAREVQHLPGANMSFRKEIFSRIQFETRFGGAAIGEETDFCLRVLRQGWKLFYDPRASVEHRHVEVGGVYDRRGFNRWVFWQCHNTTLFILRHARFTAWVPFFARRLAVILFYSLRRISPFPFLSGLRGIFRGISQHRSTRHHA